MLETLPLLAIFMIFVAFGMGLFGVIHTGVLYSIAARTYAFETFRNRTNLTYHRENLSKSVSDPRTMKPYQGRFHIVQQEQSANADITASSRPIAIGSVVQPAAANAETHNSKIFNLQSRNQTVSVNPAWIMVGYGMCLNAQCGGTDTSNGGSP